MIFASNKTENSLVRAVNVTKEYISVSPITRKKHVVQAVKNANISIQKNSIYGLIGQTGSGKSTLSRLMLGLETPTSGKVYFRDTDISTLNRSQMRALRPKIQMIFQNPFSSLNPTHKVKDIIANPLRFELKYSKEQAYKVAQEMLERTYLDTAYLEAYAHELSGGQTQRVEIARAIALKPLLLVADEPVASLDASVRGKVLNLLLELQEENDLTVLLIGHDLEVMQAMSDVISVIYKGHIVECLEAESIVDQCRHPYTQALFSKKRIDSSSAGKIVKNKKMSFSRNVLKGCPYGAKCIHSFDICFEEMPEIRSWDSGVYRCHKNYKEVRTAVKCS